MSENNQKISWTDEQRLAIETKNKTLKSNMENLQNCIGKGKLKY